MPAGTMAALAVTTPLEAFNVEASGLDCPVGDAVKNPSGPCGTAVKFTEYA